MGLKADLFFVVVGQTNLSDFCAHKVATSSKSPWSKRNQDAHWTKKAHFQTQSQD